MKDKKSRIRIKDITSYIAIITMIIASATPLNSIYYTTTVIVFFAFALINNLLGQRSISKFRVSGRAIRFAVLMIFLIVTTAVINRDDDLNYYLGLAVLTLGSLLIVLAYDYTDFSKKYYIIFSIVAAYSSILTIMFNLNKGLVSRLPLLYQPGQTLASWRSFFNIYFIWDIYARFSIIRNSACFREPGVWACFASIALVMKISDITRTRNVNKWDKCCIVALCIGIFLSFSTTGWACLALAFAIYYFEGKHTKKQALAVLGVLFLGVVAIFYFQDLLFSKLFSSNTSHISLIDRVAGVAKSIECFKAAPIFGVGYTKYFQAVNTGVNAISYLYLLGEFGIALCIIRIILEIKWIRMQKLKISSKLLLTLILILILCTQNLVSMPIIIVMELFGAKATKKSKEM